jgi:hypothetical protein
MGSFDEKRWWQFWTSQIFSVSWAKQYSTDCMHEKEAGIWIAALEPWVLYETLEAWRGKLIVCQGLELDDRVPLEQIDIQVVENDPIEDFSDEVLPHPEEEARWLHVLVRLYHWLRRTQRFPIMHATRRVLFHPGHWENLWCSKLSSSFFIKWTHCELSLCFSHFLLISIIAQVSRFWVFWLFVPLNFFYHLSVQIKDK